MFLGGRNRLVFTLNHRFQFQQCCGVGFFLLEPRLKKIFLWSKGFLNFLAYILFPLGVFNPEHSQLAFDSVVIACSLESIRPGLIHCCKAPNGVGYALSQSGLPH